MTISFEWLELNFAQKLTILQNARGSKSYAKLKNSKRFLFDKLWHL